MLVAISIPIFNSQLEKSRDAVSISNIRAAYAEAQTAVLTCDAAGDTCGNATIGTGFNFGAVTGDVTVSGVAIKSLSDNDWSGEGSDLPFSAPADGGAKVDSATVTFTYANGEITACSYN